jgi:hypothetical protein
VGAYRDLLQKTDAEVEALYDAAMGHTSPGLSLYRDELFRRDAARRDRELLGLTRQIRWLTIAVAVGTILALVLAIAALTAS